jgi:ABC-2 type transport system permease protein
MKTLARYLKLFRVQVRMSLLLGMQYRYDFLIDGVLSVFWTITALVPLVVIFHDRPTVAGWSFPAALLVTGWFTLLEGVIEGAINPSLSGVVEHIRKGTLDFVLLKPADAQFLVSTTRFEPWRVTNVLTALAIFGYAFTKLGRGPDLLGLLQALVLLAAAALVLYALWILTVSAAFYVVKVDNLTYLFSSIYDAARWPISVFRGLLRFVFTFIIPLALMTTYPAQAMLGQFPGWKLGASVLGSLVFAGLARLVWLRAISHYTSASS